MGGLAATLLTGIAMSLNKAHQELCVTSLQYPLLTFLPFSMHFSWSVCAALINWNVFLHQAGMSPGVRDTAAWGTVFLAALFGSSVSILRADPTAGFVCAWALFA